MADLRECIAEAFRLIAELAAAGRRLEERVRRLEGLPDRGCTKPCGPPVSDTRELLALREVAEAAETVCDGATCELEDDRLRYETWQHQVGAMRALREALAKLGEWDRG